LRTAVASLTLLLVAGMSGCGGGGVSPDSRCLPLKDEAPPPRPEALAALAGEYRLIFMNTQGEYGDSITRGILTLWPNDSVRRYAWVKPSLGRIPGERPLAGSFRSEAPELSSYPNQWEPSTAEHPAIELIGQTLFFGGIDALDGAGERLVIGAVTASGFAGTWQYDGGIEHLLDTVQGRFLRDPGGHFCAFRQGQQGSRGHGA